MLYDTSELTPVASPSESVDRETGSPGKVIELPEILAGVQIDLVKATQLGLTLKQAVCLGVFQRLISLEAVGHSDIDEHRWWHITPLLLTECDPGGHFAPNTWSADQHLIALERARLIASEEIDHSAQCRTAYRLRTDVVIWRDAP